MVLTFTIEFGWYVPKITVLKVYDCTSKLLLLDLGIVRIGMWRKDIRWALIETVKNLAKNKQWLVENAPAVRVARKHAYAKGKAEGTSQMGEELKYWKTQAIKHYDDLQRAHAENYELRTAIRALKRLDLVPVENEK